MRKTAYAAGAIALAATITVMWPWIAPVGPQVQTATLAGTTGRALMMGSKDLPVGNWSGDAF
jgi:hypothetical protein